MNRYDITGINNGKEWKTGACVTSPSRQNRVRAITKHELGCDETGEGLGEERR